MFVKGPSQEVRATVPGEEEEVKDPSVRPVQNLHHDVLPGGSNRERESSSRGGTTELPSQYLQNFFTRIYFL
jgi:hypothetical protein